MQTGSNRELWLSFFAILIITLAYVFVVSMFNGVPPASDFFGHSIGILGFILMLMTETLYSIRKRSRSARWGRMAAWLDFHIFTGLVGPYLVLLHTSWKFNGLAGIVMLLTIIIVISGFIGRYIYTSVPRTADGVVIEADLLEMELAQANQELQHLMANQPERLRQVVYSVAGADTGGQDDMLTVFARPIYEWSARFRLQNVLGKLDPGTRAQIGQLENLLKRRRVLERQRKSLAVARRMLALWHAIHIPIGMALFTAAFIHVGAAIYYATLLR